MSGISPLGISTVISATGGQTFKHRKNIPQSRKSYKCMYGIFAGFDITELTHITHKIRITRSKSHNPSILLITDGWRSKQKYIHFYRLPSMRTGPRTTWCSTYMLHEIATKWRMKWTTRDYPPLTITDMFLL